MIVLPVCVFLSLSLKLPFQLVYLLPSLVADWHAHILTFLPMAQCGYVNKATQNR